MRHTDINAFRPASDGAVGLRELNERSREIFKRIVEAYLATGEQVGNRSAWNRLTCKPFGIPQQSREHRRGKLRTIAVSGYLSARKLVRAGKMPMLVIELKWRHQERKRHSD